MAELELRWPILSFPEARVSRLLLQDSGPNIYKGYPVYAPGHEPRTTRWLAQQEPQLLWGDDPAAHDTRLAERRG
jgi:hypothetical protein